MFSYFTFGVVSIAIVLKYWYAFLQALPKASREWIGAKWRTLAVKFTPCRSNKRCRVARSSVNSTAVSESVGRVANIMQTYKQVIIRNPVKASCNFAAKYAYCIRNFGATQDLMLHNIYILLPRITAKHAAHYFKNATAIVSLKLIR